MLNKLLVLQVELVLLTFAQHSIGVFQLVIQLHVLSEDPVILMLAIEIVQ